MKRFLIILGIVVLIVVVAVYSMITRTKSYSPEGNVSFSDGDLNINVFYNRPTKKGRLIFGKNGLVPFGKVWRTGANEATVFETNKDLDFGGKTLPKGKYSLWTIPDEQTWKIIFNSDIPLWGMGFDGKTLRKPEKDALSIEAPAVIQEKEFEQFTISIEKTAEEMELLFIWDKTLVAAPFILK
jgi:hypothetical protein